MIRVHRPRLLAGALALFAVTVLVLSPAQLLAGPGGPATPSPTPAGTATAAGDTATPTPEPGRGGFLTDAQGRIHAERLYEEVPPRIERKREKYDRAHELQNPTGFINTDGLNITDYVGEKVVLIEFWTFGCNACQETHPHVQEWWREYRDDGLVVIGVHYPEFEYERDPANVREYVNETNTTYPVVLDNQGGTWRAYGVHAWPTRVIIGIDGFVRYRHVGTYFYRPTERKIESLLAERRRVLNRTGNASTG